MNKILLSLTIILGILSTGIAAQAQTNYSESENNDSISRADRFYARYENAVVEGDFKEKGDRDYFKIYADDTDTLKIRFYYDGNPDIDLEIYNMEGERTDKFSNVESSFDTGFYLEENDYIYVCVDHDSGDLEGDYRLYFYLK